jgi:DNA-3-methyladenine glycosylase II
MSKLYFTSDSPEVALLASRDEKMKNIIEKVGDLEFELEDDYFLSLVYGIVGQQLSGKAAAAIYKRVESLCDGSVTPNCLLSASSEAIRQCGVSNAKIGYLKGLAQKVADQEINLASLKDLPDDQVSQILMSLKGIGRWTAEMFLIFALGRLDIFSDGDVGLMRAVRQLLNVESVSKEELAAITDKWRPYRTIACLYIWEASGRGLISS